VSSVSKLVTSWMESNFDPSVVSSMLHLIFHTFLHSIIIFFHSTYPDHHNFFCCSIGIMWSNASLSLNPLLGALSCSLMSHIPVTILICVCWSVTSFSFLMGQVSLPCNIVYLAHNCCTISMIYPYWWAVVPSVWIYFIQFKFWSPQLHQYLHLH